MTAVKNWLEKIPFHCFLFGPAIIFFLFVHNWYFITRSNTYRSFGYSVLCFGLIFLFYYLLFRKAILKAGFMTSVTLVFFFSYGLIYDFFESLFFRGFWSFSHIHRILVITGMTVIVLVGIIVFISARPFRNITFSLNIFVLSLIMLNLLRLLFIIFINPFHGSIQNVNKEKTMPVRAEELKNLPDIFYIILDGCANDRILKENYNYPLNPFTEFLKGKGFYIADASCANYGFTATSIGSSLNYMYIDTFLDNVQSDSYYFGSPFRETQEGKLLISDNRVSSYLKEKGYKIVHFESGFAVTKRNNFADTTIRLNIPGEFERSLLRFSILRLDDFFGVLHYYRLKRQFENMDAVFNVQTPKFVFLHIVSPHPPFVFNSRGEYSPRVSIEDKWWEPRAEYLEQMQYTCNVVAGFINRILNRESVKPVIIVQSDHGPWLKESGRHVIYEARTRILNAFFVPDSVARNLYPEITPVNTFPVIFNGLFHDSISMQKDIPVDSAGLYGNPIFRNMNNL